MQLDACRTIFAHCTHRRVINGGNFAVKIDTNKKKKLAKEVKLTQNLDVVLGREG